MNILTSYSPLPSLQQGVSIISLLVSMLIGLLVTLFAINAYLDSKSAALFHLALSVANENARFATSDLRRFLVMTGRNIEDSDDVFIYASANDGEPNIVDGTSTSSSRITIAYRSGYTCSGTLVDNLTTRLRLDVQTSVNRQSELYCTTLDANGGGTRQSLVEGIEHVEFIYGIDTDLDGYANRYINAAAVTAGNQWNNVVTIRAELLASSGNVRPGISSMPQQPTSYQVGANTVTPADRGRFYRRAGTTIALRNLNAITK
jgi:Tfp pilus assembly protein PilW